MRKPQTRVPVREATKQHRLAERHGRALPLSKRKCSLAARALVHLDFVDLDKRVDRNIAIIGCVQRVACFNQRLHARGWHLVIANVVEKVVLVTVR